MFPPEKRIASARTRSPIYAELHAEFAFQVQNPLGAPYLNSRQVLAVHTVRHNTMAKGSSKQSLTVSLPAL